MLTRAGSPRKEPGPRVARARSAKRPVQHNSLLPVCCTLRKLTAESRLIENASRRRIRGRAHGERKARKEGLGKSFDGFAERARAAFAPTSPQGEPARVSMPAKIFPS